MKFPRKFLVGYRTSLAIPRTRSVSPCRTATGPCMTTGQGGIASGRALLRLGSESGAWPGGKLTSRTRE